MMFGIWILWVALIVLVVWAVKVFNDYADNGGSYHSDEHSAMDILRERFAKGEIDKTEFEKKRRIISHRFM